MQSIHIDQLHIRAGEKVLVDISFTVQRSLALVGESGSGKSLTLKSLLGLLDGSLECKLEKRAPFEWIRGKSVSLVPQNPFTALSPLTRIKDQMFVDTKRSEELFGFLGLDADLMDRYPPELSGGQLQRVVVAMALGPNPKLLLLDEPTTALDPASKEIMVDLLRSLQQKVGFSILFVTHEMAMAEKLCEDICVLKKGKIVEAGVLADVIANPRDPYTRRLIDAEFKNRGFRE